MVAGTRANASAAMTNVEVVTGTTSKLPVFSGNHGNYWTIWQMKMTAHLVERDWIHVWIPILKQDCQQKRMDHSMWLLKMKRTSKRLLI
jgi:hypothetical protein